MKHVRTKMICTIGPAVRSPEKIEELIDAGMNVARLNFSHGTHDEHKEVIEWLKAAREKKKVPLAIMLDTKGPEIRVGAVENNAVQLSQGQELKLVKDDVEGNGERITIKPCHVIDHLREGMTVLFDDGYITSKVVKVGKDACTLKVENTAILKTNKGVNIPSGNIPLPHVTEQDVADIAFGCAQDIDFIAASFVQSADTVIAIRDIFEEHKGKGIKIIAKIESAGGVKHFDSILQVADGIMVARGDLGVELPLSQVPQLQKVMIRKSYHHSKMVVTATQMLESMIGNSRPTRAEASDVANAIYDSTSAVMLSGETAVGQFPIIAAKTMRQIIEESEKHFNYQHFFQNESTSEYNDISTCLALASVKTAYNAHAQGIFAYTSTGFTARLMSRFRPDMPILALTQSKKTYHQLALSWGVVPIFGTAGDMAEAFDLSSCFALRHGYARYGDLFIVSAGNPFGITGTTNMMIVENIGDVIVRGSPTHGEPITANITHVLASDTSRKHNVEGKIAVLAHCDESFEKILAPAAAIVLQNLPEDHDSERAAKEIAKTLKIPCMPRADGACALLEEDQLVTLDATKGIIFKGLIEDESDVVHRFCKLD